MAIRTIKEQSFTMSQSTMVNFHQMTKKDGQSSLSKTSPKSGNLHVPYLLGYEICAFQNNLVVETRMVITIRLPCATSHVEKKMKKKRKRKRKTKARKARKPTVLRPA